MMNRKRVALFTSLTVLISTVISNTNPLRNTITHEVNAAQVKGNSKIDQKYPNITQKLDLVSMEQYSSDNLFMNVTLKKFYVKDTALDQQGKYYLLLTPIKTSNQYFLVTIKSSQKIQAHRNITVRGFLDGKTRINNEQIQMGLDSKYLNKKVVSMMGDNFSLD